MHENACIYKPELKVVKQQALQVFYDEKVVAIIFVDLFVENEVTVELKTVVTITEIHQAQLMNYLIACNKRCGLILNFAKPRIEIKRKLNG